MLDESDRSRTVSTARISAALERALHCADGLLDLLPIAVFACDRDGVVTHYNRHAAELLGMAPIAGARFYDACKALQPDGRALDPAQSPIGEVLRTGRPVRDRESVIERPDGTRRNVVTGSTALFGEDGAIIGAVTCFQDVTELRAAREKLGEQDQRLAATYESAGIGISEVDAGGRLLRINETVCAVTGYAREELLGLSVFDVTHPQDRQSDLAAYRLHATSGDRYVVEKRLIRKDGAVIWVRVASSTVRDSAGRFLYGIRVMEDITERKRAEAGQRLLIEELNHRVKNTLATVQSLASQTARGAPSLDVFRERLEGRLIALSRAHDQLSQRNWEHADLRAIATAALSPYLLGGSESVAVTGEPIALNPKAALTFAMIFHELATNAAKYGALSQPGGRLELTWKTQHNGSGPRLHVEWRERDGPAVTPPERRGFGSLLVERGIGADLGGQARLDFAPTGVVCEIEVPLANGR
jgi:PAS domain S-box-containing protein